jgi:hypothetical protein
VIDPGSGVFHGPGSETAAMDAAVDFAMEEAGGLEHAKVLGDGGQGNVEGRGEFGDGGLSLGEAGEDRAASGVGEGTEGGVERGRIVNHTV